MGRARGLFAIAAIRRSINLHRVDCEGGMLTIRLFQTFKFNLNELEVIKAMNPIIVCHSLDDCVSTVVVDDDDVHTIFNVVNNSTNINDINNVLNASFKSSTLT